MGEDGFGVIRTQYALSNAEFRAILDDARAELRFYTNPPSPWWRRVLMRIGLMRRPIDDQWPAGTIKERETVLSTARSDEVLIASGGRGHIFRKDT